VSLTALMERVNSDAAIPSRRKCFVLMMYARYNSRNDATLANMENSFCRFQTFKDGSSVWRDGDTEKGEANALRTELVKKQTVCKGTNSAPWTLSKEQRKMNAWQQYIIHRIVVSKQLHSDFNFPTIPLMSHWVEQICQ